MQKCAYGLLDLKPRELWDEMGPHDFLMMMDGYHYGREVERAHQDRELHVLRRIAFDMHTAWGGKAFKTPQDIIELSVEAGRDKSEDKAEKLRKAASLYKKARKRGSI